MGFPRVLHRKLLFRLTIPAVLGISMLVRVLSDYAFVVRFPPVTFALILPGIAVGHTFGRLTKVSWNSDRTQLILDGGQIAILVAYVAVRVVSVVVIHIELAGLTYAFDVIFLLGAGFWSREVPWPSRADQDCTEI